MRHCLDTTFLSDLVRGVPPAALRLRAWHAAGDAAATTEVNVVEVALGIELTRGRQKRDRYAEAWARALRVVEVIPFTRRASLTAARRQAQLYGEGAPAPFPDLFIAAAAKVGGCATIVSRNRADFERIGLLPVIDH